MEILGIQTAERLTAVLSYKHLFPKSADNEDPREDEVKGHKCRHLMHDDLLQKLDDLRIFLADLCEYQKYKTLKADPELLIPFEVTGFTIGGADETRGVTLIGKRILNENRVVNLITPFVKFDPEHSHYPKAEELFEAVMAASVEIDLYLNGKKRPSIQMELFDNEEGGLEGVKVTVEHNGDDIDITSKLRKAQ